MTLEPDAARQEMADIERARSRALEMHNYAKAGPIFAVWGLVWLSGFAAKGLDYAGADTVMLAGIVLGVAASIVLGLRSGKMDGAPAANRRGVFGGAIFGGLMASVVAILGPSHSQEATAIVSLIVAAAYGVAGLFLGMRISILGAVLTAVVFSSWLGARDYFELIISLAGGGVLIGFGLWLGRQ